MTTNLIDLQHSDVIMATSNMAENHPVGFQWVMKAKERGAKLIHVDPRYTRTSAAADIHVPLRSGTNIAFFGGLMSYAIQKNLYFKDYVVHYTNASFLLDPAFKTPTDLDGLFTGFDGTKKSYDRASWKYQLDGEGNPKRDLSLKDPQTVFQHLKRHYSRYTPEMVEKVCGIPKAKFEEVAKLYCGTSGPDKTGTITYALNLTQHTNGVENIRSLCMLQLLLGNIGRPGGGVTALRGHANVQGATDLELLYHELPGYLAMPLRDAHPDLKTYLETETAEVWKEPGKDPKEVKTEVFFIPAAPAAEKDGSLTNTMRLIQWHEKAVDPPGDVQTDAQFICTLAHRLQKMYASSKKERDKGFRAANFTYGAKPDHPEMVEVLKEVNGVATEDITDKEGKVLYKKGQPIASFAQLTDDGKTTSGCWIYTGVTVESPDGKLLNKAASRKPAEGNDYLAHGWGFAWPANRRILYNRASADLAGKPWSEKKKLIWWDPAAPGQKPEDKPGKWVGLDVPDFNAFLAPDAKNGDKPFIMRSDLVGGFFGPLNDGPFPEHYEPVESPTKNLLSKQQMNPVVKIWKVPDQKNELAPVGSKEYPYVITTYRLTEHHLSGVMSRYLPMLAELHHSHFAEISHELAKELGIQNGEKITVATPRGKIHVRAMVTNRLKPFVIDGKKVHEIGVPRHWGYNGS